MVALIAAIVVVLLVLGIGVRTVRIIPQARVGIIQRLGNYYSRSRLTAARRAARVWVCG